MFTDKRNLFRDGIAISWNLVICSLIISIPTFMIPGLRSVFTAATPHAYPWWFVTALFVHDNQVIPLNLHLIGNVAVVAFFGSHAERILGTKRLLYVILTAWTAQLAVSSIIGSFGDGLSGIAWALAPLLVPITIVQLKKHRWLFWRDKFVTIAVVLYIAIWVVVTVISAQIGLTNTNIWHATATVVGLAFTLAWRKDLLSSQAIVTRIDQKIRRWSLVLPALLVILLVSVATDILPLMSHVDVRVDPLSGSIEQINKNGGFIKVTFSEPMAPSYSVHSSIDSPWGDLDVTAEWLDEHTFALKFSRPIRSGESVNLTLEKFKDARRLPVPNTVVLQYR